MRAALVSFLLTAACSFNQGQVAGRLEPSLRYHCGEAFALALNETDQVTSRSPVEDFVLHTLTTPKGKLVIYEGNAPEPGGIVLRAGRDWPNYIVIHDSPGNLTLASEVRTRMFLGRARTRHCPATNTG